MKFTKCDRCGKVESRMGSFEFPIHIVEEKTSYVDRDFTPVSGRMVKYDICNKCYNSIMLKAFEIFKEKSDG